MIEPRAFIEHHKGGDNLTWERVDHPYAKASPLTTVADVLAALRDCSPEAITAMHDAMATLPSKNKFDRCRALRSGLLALLDQFERDQGSAT